MSLFARGKTLFHPFYFHQVRVQPITSNNQKGQASVFVLALIGVVLLCGIFLYQSGRLTSEKMQLQNAADAAAFGAATLEARSLNFTAYTNRAMVANEVAIGQMVGMLSFVDELKSTGEYIDAYAAILEGIGAIFLLIPVAGEVIEGIITEIVGTLEEIGSTITEVGEETEKVMEAILSPIIFGFSAINFTYSWSQEVYHWATIILVTTNIFQCLEDNVPGTSKFTPLNLFDPNKPGAHLSDLGILALVGHIPSYVGLANIPTWLGDLPDFNGYTKRYTPAKQKKKKKKSEEEEEKEEKDQELLTKYQRLVKKDQEAIDKDGALIKADKKKYKSDLKKSLLDGAELAKEEKKCAELKKKWNNNKTKENKENSDACQDRLNTHYLPQQARDQAALKEDKKKLQEHQAKLKKDQDSLAEHQKKLKNEQERQVEDEKKEEEEEKKEEGDEKEENEGMQRMAATIREARDPFSSGGPPVVDKNIFNLPFKFGNRDWEFGYGFDVNIHVGKIHLGKLGFFMGLDSYGGSELRYKNNNYVWSALDTALLETVFTFGSHKIGVGAPIGGGGYQATGKSGGSEDGEEEEGIGNMLTVLDMPPTLGYYGDPKAYGSAGYPFDRWIAWEGAAAEMEENVMESYGGLRPYRDMADVEVEKKRLEAFPWTAPFFLVGVIRKFDDINRTGPKFSGNLDLLEENRDIDRVGAIAKAELYFNRPMDLRYFLRSDKKKENPNVFSPFWQARLAKTSDWERFLAMAVQHKKIWVAKSDSKSVIDGIDSLGKDLKKILDLFF